MKCPVCDDSELRLVSVKGLPVKLSLCPECNGVWGDKEKLAWVLGKRVVRQLSIPVYATISSRACPSCGQSLSEFIYPGSEIEIDGCSHCEGFWFDYREINAIKQAEKENLRVECPRCQTPNRYTAQNHAHASCVSCGVLLKNYFDVRGGALPPPVPESGMDDGGQDEDEFEGEGHLEGGWENVRDLRREYQYSLYTIPAMLLIAVLFNLTSTGAWMQRTWLGMPVHELGHAVMAWFSGFFAIPSLWVTVTFSDTRGFLAPLLLAAGIAYLIYLARRLDSRQGLMFAVALLLIQIICTLFISLDTANMLITFAGDGVGMVLATALMASFYYGKQTNLYNGHLRWGFVAIGAAAFVDMYSVWLRSLANADNVPYGTTGGRYTDSYKLIEFHGWSFDTLIGRYLWLGTLCLVVLAVIYYFGLKKARTMMEGQGGQ
jgi:Zn-finger nucleic acid-binding protein